jgi:hypothetical protein
MRTTLLLLVLGATLAIAGCRRPAGPAEAYRAFAAAAAKGEVDAVWARLSERSRQALDARAKETAARTGGATPASGRDLVIGDLAFQSPRVKNVTVIRESQDEAVVAVEVEGTPGAREVSLARESGVWRVVLPFGN